MQLHPPNTLLPPLSYAFPTSIDQFCILRFQSTCDVLIKMNNGPMNVPWKDAFKTIVETCLQEAEDLMLSLPYTQIRHQICRLAPALESVRVANLVRADLGDSLSVLVDIDLKNIVASEHSKYATANGCFPNRGVEVHPLPHNGNAEGTERQSKLEIVKTELQATQPYCFPDQRLM
jgi:hypothetical protein